MQLVNNAAVEYVTAPNGEVTVYWIHPDGTPLPPAEVSMPRVNVTSAMGACVPSRCAWTAITRWTC